MFLAFLLSCSEGTPFGSLLLELRLAPVLAFLIIGPMLDIMNLPHDETLSQSALHLAIHGHRDPALSLLLFLHDRSNAMIRFIILLGYFTLTLYLQLSGKLSHYINLHYSYLVYISMVLFSSVGSGPIPISGSRKSTHIHLESRQSRRISILLLSLPLLIGVAFPTVSWTREPYLPEDIISTC